jgi:hypothetical protein
MKILLCSFMPRIFYGSIFLKTTLLFINLTGII